MILKYFIRVLLVLLVFAAVSHPPAPVLAASKTVILKGAELKGSVSRFKKPSRFLWTSPFKVDGKKIHGIFKVNTRVPSGTHTFQVNLSFSLGRLFEAAYEGHTTVRATLIQDRNYETTGKVENRTVSVWIVDAKTRQRVSDISSFTVKDCPVRIGLCLF
jgi:hypothetical protein